MKVLYGPKWSEPLAEGKGAVARQGLEEAIGKTRTRRTEIGYKACVCGVSRHWTVTPDNHSDTTQVNPARAGGKRHVLPWEVSGSV